MTQTSTNRKRISMILVLLLVGGGVAAIIHGIGLLGPGTPVPVVTPSPTFQERLIPTPTPEITGAGVTTPQTAGQTTPVAEGQGTADSPPGTARPAPATPSPTAPVPSPSPTAGPTTIPPTATTPPTALKPSPTLTTAAGPAASPSPTQQPAPEMFTVRQRIGVSAPRSDVDRYDMARLGAGWYLQSETRRDPSRPAGMEAVQFVGVTGDSYSPGRAGLQDVARHNPGTLWLIGNEPDVIWQSNATPQQYARVYHETYFLLKEADPTCQVAIGAISQVTPLRLRYLERVLAAYQSAYGQPMPVDVWNIHLAILREERGSWGVDIPPGLPDDSGILYEIGDNADIGILKQQVKTFRRWMAGQGWRDKPLIVTEFSVLMPPDYGFPFGVVKTFMTSAFDFLLNARDSATGCPADGNLLVQRWAWYSVADTVYSTGNLFDPNTGQITPLGQAFADYVARAVP